MAKKGKGGNVSWMKFLVLSVLALATIATATAVQKRQINPTEAAELARTIGIVAKPPTVKPGEKVNVVWYSVNALPKSWIGLYNVGASDNQYLDKKDTDECFLSAEQRSKAGECVFAMSQTGVYEFRLFKGKIKAATSNKVTVATDLSPSITRAVTVTRMPSPTPTPLLTVAPSITPKITCYPPPPCYYSEPRCMIQDIPDWCVDY